MSIQPIDLQNLLLRLDQIGKEQASQREAITQHQAVAGSEIAHRSEETERQVGETQIVEEGPEQVNEQEEGHGDTKEDEDSDENDSKEKQEIVSDPNVGQNIDLVG